MKKIILAKTAGFCWGVRRAIDMALKASESFKTQKVYTYGPLIHNNKVIEILRSENIHPISDQDLDRLDNSIVVIRAHGIPLDIKQKFRKRDIKMIDATCPHVARSQKKIEEFSAKNFNIVIVGDKKHAEVLSLKSIAKNNVFIISSTTELDNINLREPICVIAQSTFNKQVFEKILNYLQRKFKNIHIINSICPSAIKRQEEVWEIANKVDAFIVVGSKESANTKRLYQISLSTGKPAFLIEDENELKNTNLDNYQTIGITGGASTPDWLINNIIETIKKRS